MRESVASSRRRRRLSEQIVRRHAWARVRYVVLLVVLGTTVVLISFYLAERSAYIDTNILIPPQRR